MKTTKMADLQGQVLLILADYATCKIVGPKACAPSWEDMSKRVAADIADRVMNNYIYLSGRTKRQPFMVLAQAKIEALVNDAAAAKHDPWAACRNEGTRLSMAKEIVAAINRKVA